MGQRFARAYGELCAAIEETERRVGGGLAAEALPISRETATELAAYCEKAGETPDRLLRRIFRLPDVQSDPPEVTHRYCLAARAQLIGNIAHSESLLESCRLPEASLRLAMLEHFRGNRKRVVERIEESVAILRDAPLTMQRVFRLSVNAVGVFSALLLVAPDEAISCGPPPRVDERLPSNARAVTRSHHLAAVGGWLSAKGQNGRAIMAYTRAINTRFAAAMSDTIAHQYFSRGMVHALESRYSRAAKDFGIATELARESAPLTRGIWLAKIALGWEGIGEDTRAEECRALYRAGPDECATLAARYESVRREALLATRVTSVI